MCRRCVGRCVWVVREVCGSCVSVVDLQCVNLHSSVIVTTFGDLATHMVVIWTNEIQGDIDA